MISRRPIEPRSSAAMAAVLAVLATFVALCAFTGAALAYLSGTGSGAGHAVIGSLAAPTGVTATVAGSTVSVAWTAAASPAGTADDGYYVQRFAGATATAACGSSPGHLISAATTSCTDSGSPAGSGVPAGAYTYRVTAVFRTWTAQSAASNSAVVAPASLSLAPTSGHVGATVAISGQSFAPNASIGATYDGNPITLAPSTTTDATGSFSGASFTVPASTAGAHTVRVGDGTNTASASFTVKPSITLSPASGVAGTTDTVSASGFAAGKTVTATFNGTAVTLGGTTSTDASGSLSGATYTVPNDPAGEYAVAIADASTNTAGATYTIATPAISLSPSTAHVGATVTISGSSFPASSTISATYDGSAVTLSGTTTTTAAGAIPSGLTFTVPASAAGGHAVQVTAGARSATTTLTVTPSISLTPTSGVVGSSDAITATGLAAGSSVTATFNGISVALSSSTTTGAGSLSATYTVPSNPQGTYTVQLKDASANSASATYTISATAPSIAITSCTGGSGHRNTIAGTTTQNVGTVTVSVFVGAGTGGTLAATLSTSSFTGSSSPFGWSATTANAQLTAGSTYTARATQTDPSGTSNSPTCTFTAN